MLIVELMTEPAVFFSDVVQVVAGAMTHWARDRRLRVDRRPL